jgi:hypothetical protein
MYLPCIRIPENKMENIFLFSEKYLCMQIQKVKAFLRGTAARDFLACFFTRNNTKKPLRAN